MEAREKMAQIYLTHRKDRRLYAGCYRELAEKCPTPQTEMLLGDAYMAIQEVSETIIHVSMSKVSKQLYMVSYYCLIVD